MAAWCLHIMLMMSPLWPCWSGSSGEPAGDAGGCLVEAADGRPASMVWSALLAEVGSNDALKKGHRCWLQMEYWLEWKLEMLWKHQMVIQNEVQMVHVLEQRLEQLVDHEVDRSDPVGPFDGEPVVVMLDKLESVLEMVLVTRLVWKSVVISDKSLKSEGTISR